MRHLGLKLERPIVEESLSRKEGMGVTGLQQINWNAAVFHQTVQIFVCSFDFITCSDIFRQTVTHTTKRHALFEIFDDIESRISLNGGSDDVSSREFLACKSVLFSHNFG